MRSRIEPMKKIARTLRSHRELLLNYFRAKRELSSGVVEGLNNKAKLTMRKSYGFRTFRSFCLGFSRKSNQMHARTAGWAPIAGEDRWPRQASLRGQNGRRRSSASVSERSGC
jgi:hypothetical protein